MFKVNNKDTRTTPNGVLLMSLYSEYISHLNPVFLLLTLSMQMPTGDEWLHKSSNLYFCCCLTHTNNFPPNIYLFKVNNRDTGKTYEICFKLTIKTPERRHWRTDIDIFHTTVNFEQVNVSWVIHIGHRVVEVQKRFPLIHFSE